MHNPLKRFIEFIKTPGHSRTISVVVILIIAAAVPLTVLVAQKQQELRQHAVSNGSSCATVGIKSCNGNIPMVCLLTSPPNGKYWEPAGPACTYGCLSNGTCAAAPNPCSKMISGKYVIGGVCSGNTLYTCNGKGGSTGSKVCTYGCKVNSGTYDTCKSAPAPTATPTPCTSNSLRCTSNPAQIQVCQNGVWVTSNCGGSYICQNTSTGTHCVLPTPTPCTGSCQASSSYCGTGSYGSYNSAGNSYCNSSTNGGHPYCCNKPTTTPTPAPVDPCTHKINGVYVKGGYCPSPYGGKYLYNCLNGKTVSKTTCTYGCQYNSGTYDTCKSAPAPTPAPIPNCNAGGQLSTCIATKSNTCSTNNGTQTVKYTTYNGSTKCTPVSKTQTCTISSCSVGNVCTNGTCVAKATPTPVPSLGPTPTPVPGHTMLAFSIGMDGIGSAGDNVNPNPSSSNQTPGHTTRSLAVEIFDSNNNEAFSQVGSINYNSGQGLFTGTVDLGASFANGNYTIKVKSDGHLKKLIPGIQNISSALTQPLQMSRVNLVAGDVDNNNLLNLSDYNILLSCVTSPYIANIDDHGLCNTNSNYIINSDLEDNGVVNEFDYNLFLREYAVQNGD